MEGEIDPASILRPKIMLLQCSLILTYNVREVVAECLPTEPSHGEGMCLSMLSIVLMDFLE